MTSEDQARENIDRMLKQAGWEVRDPGNVNILAFRGLAIRKISLKPGHGEGDQLLYIDRRAAGIMYLKRQSFAHD